MQVGLKKILLKFTIGRGGDGYINDLSISIFYFALGYFTPEQKMGERK